MYILLFANHFTASLQEIMLIIINKCYCSINIVIFISWEAKSNSQPFEMLSLSKF